MNRVKKISKRYEAKRPEIDQQRAIRSHTRRARKAAAMTQLAFSQIAELKEALSQKSVKELKELAADAKIKGRSKMNKDELVEALLIA